jgi:hypothetical protein
MYKLFLVLLPGPLDRDKVIAHLEVSRSISFWFYNLPSSFFVRTHLTAAQLQANIAQGFSFDRIFIININSTTDLSGLVPDDHAVLFTNR